MRPEDCAEAIYPIFGLLESKRTGVHVDEATLKMANPPGVFVITPREEA